MTGDGISEPQTVHDWLRALARQDPDRPLLHFEDKVISRGELDAHTNQFANFLRSRNIEFGEKIAIVMPNCLEFVVAWLGASKVGVVYVPINTEYRGALLEYQLVKADVVYVVVGSDYLPRLLEIADRLPKLRGALVVDPPESSQPTALRIEAFSDVSAASRDEPDSLVNWSDPHAINFTSGTTGPSKGVLASHRHVLTFARDWIRCCEFTSQDRLYTGMPLFHALGSWLGVLTTIMVGAEALLVPRFSASRYWSDVRKFRATIGHGIFSVVPILLKQPPRDDDAEIGMTRFYLGQESPEFEQRYGCRIIEPYGQTETGFLTYTPLRDVRRKGSCGRVNSENYELKIVDEFDNERPTGEVGEFVARPRHAYGMMTEYYNDPAATAAAFRNLWFHTGDFGRVDEDGYYYYVDRGKDMLRRRGQNISSYEFEHVLNQHPKILECAAVARASELGEDDVMAVIAPKAGESLTPQEIWSYCEQNMPKFWVPRYVEICAELPKTPTQKIQKYLLRRTDRAATIYDREATTPLAAAPA